MLIFEQHFIAVYLQERLRRSDREEGARGAPVDHGQDALEPARGPLPLARAHSALALPTIGFGSVYMKLWHTLTALVREPHPQVAQMAADIVAYVADQVDSVGREPEARGGSSSLPPSPHARPDAPPRAPRRLPHAASDEPVAAAGSRAASPAPAKAPAPAPAPAPCKRAIVATHFVDWASAQFARADSDARADDCESRAHHERAWRRTRNASLRREAKGEPLPHTRHAPNTHKEIKKIQSH